LPSYAIHWAETDVWKWKAEPGDIVKMYDLSLVEENHKVWEMCSSSIPILGFVVSQENFLTHDKSYLGLKGYSQYLMARALDFLMQIGTEETSLTLTIQKITSDLKGYHEQFFFLPSPLFNPQLSAKRNRKSNCNTPLLILQKEFGF
jgi:hypothetical protein